jgi:RNA polymerase sigma factor (sigma-70 family)
MEDKQMEDYKKPIAIDYCKEYPGVSDEIVKVLEKSDLKMKYQEHDLKVDHHKVDKNGNIIKHYPAREQSYEALLEEDKQFQSVSENTEDIVEKNLMIERMMTCFAALPKKERDLIYDLFFADKNEYQMAEQLGISQQAVSKKKEKILKKLKKTINN